MVLPVLIRSDSNQRRIFSHFEEIKMKQIFEEDEKTRDTGKFTRFLNFSLSRKFYFVYSAHFIILSRTRKKEQISLIFYHRTLIRAQIGKDIEGNT